jgi:glucose/mannose transport system substrate-binding protein
MSSEQDFSSPSVRSEKKEGRGRDGGRRQAGQGRGRIQADLVAEVIGRLGKKAVVCMVAALGLGASTAFAVGEDTSAAGPTVTIYHWWTSPSESAALGALVDLFQKKYPKVKVSAVSLGGGSNRPVFSIIKRLAGTKQAPDAFQSNAGYASQVFFDAGLLSPLDELWARDKLEPVIPGVIRDLSRFEGHYYSIPIAVHRMNVIWYNKPLLDKHRIDPNTLTTWEAFFRAAQTLKAGGVQNPIQMGVTWTVANTFEGIMASLGISAYEDWINGRMTTATDPRLVKAFSILKQYLAYANRDHDDVAWNRAVRRIMNGDGAFCLMGDWANGEFRVAGMKYGKDFGALPVPGTRGMFGLNVDTFQRPRGSAEPTNSNRWLSLAGSREGQDAFNPLKGSIPARSDADVTRYDAYQRAAIVDLKSAEYKYPNASAAAPEGLNSQTTDILVIFMVDEDVNKAASAMAASAVRLTAAGKFRRVWSLSVR